MIFSTWYIEYTLQNIDHYLLHVVLKESLSILFNRCSTPRLIMMGTQTGCKRFILFLMFQWDLSCFFVFAFTNGWVELLLFNVKQNIKRQLRGRWSKLSSPGATKTRKLLLPCSGPSGTFLTASLIDGKHVMIESPKNSRGPSSITRRCSQLF